MTRWIYRGGAVLALSAGLALAQPAKKDPAPKEPPKPAAGSLEETLDLALRNSADIKVAEAKVRDAEAELNRVRQQVLMKGTMLHNDLRLAKRILEAVEAAYARQDAARRSGVPGPTDSLDAARLALEKQKGEVEKLEAELKALRGEFAIHRGLAHLAFSPDGQLLADVHEGKVRLWDTVNGRVLPEIGGKAVWDFARGEPKSNVQSSMAERVRKWLDTEVESKLSPENELRLEDVFDFLRRQAKDSAPPVRLMNNTEDQQYRDNLRGPIRIGALLQALEDGSETLTFIVRDYGLLVTTKDRVPEGAVRALDLWKANEAKTPEPMKK